MALNLSADLALGRGWVLRTPLAPTSSSSGRVVGRGEGAHTYIQQGGVGSTVSGIENVSFSLFGLPLQPS